MRNLLFFFLCLLVACSTTAPDSSSKKRPKWADGYRKDMPNSYIEVISATGYSESNAREKALDQMAQSRSLATGQRVSIENQDGYIVVKGKDELTIKCRIISDYVDQYAPGEYRVYLLVQFAKNPTYDFDPVKISQNRYSTTPLFVPYRA